MPNEAAQNTDTTSTDVTTFARAWLARVRAEESDDKEKEKEKEKDKKESKSAEAEEKDDKEEKKEGKKAKAKKEAKNEGEEPDEKAEAEDDDKEKKEKKESKKAETDTSDDRRDKEHTAWGPGCDKKKDDSFGERVRIAKILSCEGASANPRAAFKFAFETDMDASTAVAMLDSFAQQAPKPQRRASLDERMKEAGVPVVGPGDDVAKIDGPQAAAAFIIRCNEKRMTGK